MMRGIIAKSLREAWLPTLIFSVALMLVEGLITFILPQVSRELSEIWLQMPMLKQLLTAMLGTDLGDQITGQMIQAIVWVHPVVLSLMWAHEIIHCTKLPAGEIDRGTIDVLLGLPVSRRRLYWAESLVWLGTGLTVLLMGLCGFLLGSLLSGDVNPPHAERTALLVANMTSLYIAVGGVAYLVSSLSDRRGRAIGAVFAIVVASFLLNFLAQFWDPAAKVSFLSLMVYYQPGPILSTGVAPVGDLVVLLSVGVIAWLLGGEVLARRSICTV